MKRGTWIWIGLGALLAAGGIAWAVRGDKKGPTWKTAKVERGSLRQRISATGALSGVVQVNVGSQVSGTISALYVDYNSQVKKGQVCAQIDATVYQASVLDAQGTLSKAQAALDDADRQLKRSQRLYQDQLIAIQDLQTAQVVLDKAKGDLANAKAALTRAQANLGYCTIKAPVSGVVVSRAIDVGQTVAASFSTPNLFVIAQDLTKMKVSASVDEADIGQVKEGQPAFFTVDSYPDSQFRGRVNQVRLEPITANNVVTYVVVVEVANEDLRLRPGMTANVTITTQSKDDVLKVPAAALRFNPLAFATAAELGIEAPQKGQGRGDKGAGVQGRQGAAMGQGQPGAGAAGGSPVRGFVSKREDRIWILDPQGRPKQVPVKVGISDGQSTEISGDAVQEGLSVLVGVEDKKSASAGSSPLGGGPGGGMRR